MKVKDFLSENNALSDEIRNVDYHMSLLYVDLDDLKNKIPELKDKNDQELLEYILWIYKVCNASDPEYDSEVDANMVRIGLKTDVFPGGHSHNKWSTGTFADDGYGFGDEPTSIYDDYVDSENEKSIK